LEEEEIREKLEYLEIRDRIESDHPVIAGMRKKERRKNGGGRGRTMGRIWGKRKLFRTRLGRVELREGEVQEVLKEMSKQIREAMERAEGEKEGDKKK